jgi:hypothetical protein
MVDNRDIKSTFLGYISLTHQDGSAIHIEHFAADESSQGCA